MASEYDLSGSIDRGQTDVSGVRSEFERSMIRERIHAGLKRAIASGKVLGRRFIEDDPGKAAKAKRARKMLAAGKGINLTAQTVGLSNSVVARLKAEMAV